MRLDKLLSKVGYGSRKEVKKIITEGLVTVNNEVIQRPQTNIDPEQDNIYVENQQIHYTENLYIMMNKPSGYECTTTVDFYPSVLELLDFYRDDLIIVGRLDVDTEGLLLLTTDGSFSHNLIHGKKKIPKTYHVELKYSFNKKFIEKLEAGITLDDGPVQPAQVTQINDKTIHLTIYEGRYHQVKRMMHYCENEVTYLKRLSIGHIQLDSKLNSGEYRFLKSKEI